MPQSAAPTASPPPTATPRPRPGCCALADGHLPPAAGFEPLERRVLFAASVDIAGVGAAALDQPQINIVFRATPDGDPLGGGGSGGDPFGFGDLFGDPFG